MRNGYALSHPGRAQALALDESLEDPALRNAGQLRCPRRQLLEKLFLALHSERRDHGLRHKQFDDFHDDLLMSYALSLPGALGFSW